jgi:hypothetical protein
MEFFRGTTNAFCAKTAVTTCTPQRAVVVLLYRMAVPLMSEIRSSLGLYSRALILPFQLVGPTVDTTPRGKEKNELEKQSKNTGS